MKRIPDFLTIMFTNVQAIHCVEAQIEERQVTGYNQFDAVTFGIIFLPELPAMTMPPYRIEMAQKV